ncbi:44615_t:CDS:2 [Gigaspora margarita]|uniref:44615_t:CDS:1 n=1 Tax=Gigaspora margarita TaxID=4874 RepID=A0ABN7UQ38_GIGMA|nr:44615_t:CDS:2 [Gigaspora margarita]
MTNNSSKFFFSPLYRNSDQTKKLTPEQTRLHTSFKILVQFNSPVILRVPLREISKYSQNDSQEEFQIPSSQRQYGWLEINANGDSIISMTMPMVLTDKGYLNNLIINLEDLDMQTTSNIVAPFLRYNQEITKILFDMEITIGRIVMSPQVSQTLETFLIEYSNDFFQVNSFSVDGNFQYYSFIHPNHVESLSMTVKGKEANLKLFGFVIRYFIILQMNYAGNYINFCELKEYVALHDPKNATGTIKRPPQAIKPPADPYEVYVTFIIEDGTLILPENLYNAIEQSFKNSFS